jgi:hypothetical protein
MGSFKLLERVAFICNICFLMAVFLQRAPAVWRGEIVSLILIMGYVLAIMVNLVVAIWWMLLLGKGKAMGRIIAPWLPITNLIFLTIQLILLFK